MQTTNEAAPERGSRNGAERAWQFLPAIRVGIFAVWLLGPLAIFFEVGDCGGSDVDCQRVWDAQAGHVPLLITSLLALTAAGVLVLKIRHRVLPAVLFTISAVVLGLGYVSWSRIDGAYSWVPYAMFLTMPGSLILALASAGELIERRRWRPAAGPPGSRDIHQR